MRLAILYAVSLSLLSGCMMVDVGVRNPVVGMTTIAVVPFFNLSQERAVDGRRFAFAYYTELQKTPGFEVIPVGVTEQAMFDHQLQMNNPEDVLQLAQILGADAVVVGAVTDYSPYYPPRVGLQVSWYSPRQWPFYPGVPTNEFERDLVKPGFFAHRKERRAERRGKCEDCPPEMFATPMNGEPAMIPRGQSPGAEDSNKLGGPRIVSLPQPSSGADAGPSGAFDTEGQVPQELPRAYQGQLPLQKSPDAEVEAAPELPPQFPSSPGMEMVPLMSPPAMHAGPPPLSPIGPFDPRQPLMSYTRMFDGADPKVTARLRDYVELSGDLRTGGWQSHLYRSEDFIRFTAHVMIVEMLQLHGGQTEKRVVFKLRKNR